MPDDLRTRIAAVLSDALVADDSIVNMQYGSGSTSQIVVNCNPLADAVIRELCLHREEMSEWAVLSEGFRGHRYVTHWEENDPAPVTKIRSAEKLGLTGDGA